MDRELAASLAIIVLGIAIAGYATFLKLRSYVATERSQGLLIVVTFPSLVEDVRQITCRMDKVVSLAPPGSDPHTYTLSLDDIMLAERADLVISTGHAPFEIKLRSYIKGERLVEIPHIPGMRVENIAGTSTPNLHMPIYDPYNYAVFIRFVAEKLAKLNPRCRQYYIEQANKVLEKLDKVTENSPRLPVDAVGSTPLTQYAVEWLGVRIKALMLVSPEIGVTSQSYKHVETLIKAHEAELVVITSLSLDECKPLGKPDEKLLALAKRYKVPVICVPAPFLDAPVPNKLEAIASQARRVIAMLKGGGQGGEMSF